VSKDVMRSPVDYRAYLAASAPARRVAECPRSRTWDFLSRRSSRIASDSQQEPLCIGNRGRGSRKGRCGLCRSSKLALLQGIDQRRERAKGPCRNSLSISLRASGTPALIPQNAQEDRVQLTLELECPGQDSRRSAG
jgi:hypothetical protein